MQKIPIKISYDTRYNLTKLDPESKKLMQTFGLQSNQKHDIVDFIFDFEPEKIHYICGLSGSGKTSILRYLDKHLANDNTKVMFIPNWQQAEKYGVKLDPDKYIIEYFSDVIPSAGDRVALLSKFGLSETWKLISTFDMLSDGEKFRFILYYCVIILSKTKKKTKILIIDEFCATLDRLTAKSICGNISKIMSKFGVTIIAASTHNDIAPYLNPDHYWYKEDEQISKTKA